MQDKKSTTVAAYLGRLPADRRQQLETVRRTILANLDGDYEEGMLYGMIGYYVPHRVFPDGYHCDPDQPLCYAGLSAQKHHMSVYLMCVYGSPELREWFAKAWAKSGKKLDMGKSCIRFQKAEDLALDVLGAAIRRVPAKKYVAHYQQLLASAGQKRAARKVAKQTAARKRARAAR